MSDNQIPPIEETPEATTPPEPPVENGGEESMAGPDFSMQARLERLGGEPAPDITPEEFARLQQSGQIHIDPRGRVRSTTSRTPYDAGVSLRKRRAWYYERRRITVSRKSWAGWGNQT